MMSESLLADYGNLKEMNISCIVISTLSNKTLPQRIILRLEPRDEVADTLVQVHFRLVSDFRFQFRRVRIRHIDIAELHRFHDLLSLST